MVGNSSGVVRNRRTRSSTTAGSRAGILRILEPHLNVCRWRRSISRRFLSELAEVTKTAPKQVASLDHGGTTGSLVEALVPHAPVALTAWLTKDIEKVRVAFRLLNPGAPIVTQLEVVTSDKCRRFHADYKALRAVCTYAGPSTQWVEDAAVDRVAIEDRSEATPMDVQNSRIVRSASAIRQASEGDVVLLKGDSFHAREGLGAVHRSPPIEASGLRRLVLTLDFA